MSVAKYNKLVKEVSVGLHESAEEMAEMSFGEVTAEEMAYETASSLLFDEPWITKFLQSRGVRDVQGRLADDLYSGRGV